MQTCIRVCGLALVLTGACAASVTAEVFRVAEMTTTQIERLDRTRTAVIMPGGILEEHGPYLPAYTDGYVNEFVSNRLAQAIAARPGWSVLMFPPLPIGVNGAQTLAGMLRYPGTYDVRETTLRDVYLDLSSALGDQGFRWIFVVSWHGAPPHHRALDQASLYFRARYDGRLVHLPGLLPVVDCQSTGSQPCPSSPLSADALAEEGFSPHAGVHEHGRVLFVRPDLVDPGYRSARSFTARGVSDLWRVSRQEGWAGYWGAPRHATAEDGRIRMEAFADRHVNFALRILDGLDDGELPRYASVWGPVWGSAFLWIVAALTFVWMALALRWALGFRNWRGRVRTQAERRLTLVVRHILPVLLMMGASILVLLGLRMLGYSLWMLRLPPDMGYPLMLLAVFTLLAAPLKLAVVAVSARRAARAAPDSVGESGA